MPLSWPYGVTGPVVGQMFHVKHWLWRCWCSGRRRARPPARLGVLTSFGAAPRSPPVPSGPSGALHTGGTWCAGPPWPRRRSRAPQPGPVVPPPPTAPRPGPDTAARPSSAGRPRGVLCIDAAPWRCSGRARRRGVVWRAREGMQKVRSPCGSADLRGTPAWPEFAQWRSAFTRCLVSASSLS